MEQIKVIFFFLASNQNQNQNAQHAQHIGTQKYSKYLRIPDYIKMYSKLL